MKKTQFNVLFQNHQYRGHRKIYENTIKLMLLMHNSLPFNDNQWLQVQNEDSKSENILLATRTYN